MSHAEFQTFLVIGNCGSMGLITLGPIEGKFGIWKFQ
jgi:hypothetical protein